MSARIARGAAAAVLAVSVLLAAHASRVLSTPNDELWRVVTGLSYLRFHDFRMDFATPPLAKYLVAAPLLGEHVRLPTDTRAWRESDDERWVHEVVYDAGNDPLAMLRRARPPMLLVLLALGALVFAWSRRLYGPAGAVLSTALIALTPNTLAYAWFANMDFALGLTYPLAVFTYWRYLERPGPGRLVLAGLGLGAALATHLASLALGLVLPLLALVAYLSRALPPARARRPLRMLGALAGIGAVALLFVWAIYGFETRPLLEHAPHPEQKIAWIEAHVPGPPALRAGVADAVRSLPVPGASYARGILNILRRTGELGTQGYWWFYLASFFAKVPLPALLLMGWAFMRRPRRPRPEEWFLLVPAAVLFVLASRSVYQSGLRNIYPVLPLLAVYTGRVLEPRGAAAAPPARSRAPIAAAILALWLALITFSVHPHYLSYFNALVGGPRGGIRAAVGSVDLDWGQGLVGLRKAMAENGVREVYLATPGRVRPSLYGVRARRVGPDALARPASLPPGVYAVSTTYVRRMAWLRKRTPFARVGNVLWLYRLNGERTGRKGASGAPYSSTSSTRIEANSPVAGS